MTQGEWICPKCGEKFPYIHDQIVNVCTNQAAMHQCVGKTNAEQILHTWDNNPSSPSIWPHETLGALKQSLAERDALREELLAMTAERDELEVEIKRAWDNCSTYIKERDEAIDCRDKAEYELRSLIEESDSAEAYRKLQERAEAAEAKLAKAREKIVLAINCGCTDKECPCCVNKNEWLAGALEAME